MRISLTATGAMPLGHSDNDCRMQYRAAFLPFQQPGSHRHLAPATLQGCPEPAGVAKWLWEVVTEAQVFPNTELPLHPGGPRAAGTGFDMRMAQGHSSLAAGCKCLQPCKLAAISGALDDAAFQRLQRHWAHIDSEAGGARQRD